MMRIPPICVMENGLRLEWVRMGRSPHRVIAMGLGVPVRCAAVRATFVLAILFHGQPSESAAISPAKMNTTVHQKHP